VLFSLPSSGVRIAIFTLSTSEMPTNSFLYSFFPTLVFPLFLDENPVMGPCNRIQGLSLVGPASTFPFLRVDVFTSTSKLCFPALRVRLRFFQEVFERPFGAHSTVDRALTIDCRCTPAVPTLIAPPPPQAIFSSVESSRIRFPARKPLPGPRRFFQHFFPCPSEGLPPYHGRIFTLLL